ncbi:hypothetical protein ACKWTF_000385 [Chironomus riparius]
MKSVSIKFVILSVCCITFIMAGSNYRFPKVEKCIGDGKRIALNKFEVFNEFMVNLNLSINVGLDFIKFKMSVFKKNPNGEFQEIFKSIPALNWCKVMDGTSKQTSNPMIKIALMIVKARISEIYKMCPIGPLILEKNFTLPNEVIAFCPSGLYRVNLLCMYKNNEIILDCTFLMEIF